MTWPARIAYWVVVLVLAAPLLAMLPLSLNPAGFPTIWPEQPSIAAFERVLTYPEWQRPFLHSSLLGALAATLAMMVSIPASVVLVRARGPIRIVLIAAFSLPLSLPPIGLAVGLYAPLAHLGLIDRLAGLLPVHVALCTPVVLFVLVPSMANISSRLISVTRTLGASPVLVATRVLIPLVLPAVLRAWFVAFCLSFDEAVIALYLSASRFETLPHRLWTGLRFEMDPGVPAAGVVVLAISVSALIVITRLEHEPPT